MRYIRLRPKIEYMPHLTEEQRYVNFALRKRGVKHKNSKRIRCKYWHNQSGTQAKQWEKRRLQCGNYPFIYLGKEGVLLLYTKFGCKLSFYKVEN